MPDATLHAALLAVHLLAVVVWVGGMVFAHFFLRPALAALAPPQRLALMHEVLSRFFAAVLAASLLALATGLGMWGIAARAAGAGFAAPWNWTAMGAGGVVMVAVFLYIRFGLYPRMATAVAASQWPAAGAVLARIRGLVVFNLALGVAVVIVAVLGPRT